MDVNELGVNRISKLIEEKKKEGYEVVGIEQSNTSKKLGDF